MTPEMQRDMQAYTAEKTKSAYQLKHEPVELKDIDVLQSQSIPSKIAIRINSGKDGKGIVSAACFDPAHKIAGIPPLGDINQIVAYFGEGCIVNKGKTTYLTPDSIYAKPEWRQLLLKILEVKNIPCAFLIQHGHNAEDTFIVPARTHVAAVPEIVVTEQTTTVQQQPKAQEQTQDMSQNDLQKQINELKAQQYIASRQYDSSSTNQIILKQAYDEQKLTNQQNESAVQELQKICQIDAERISLLEIKMIALNNVVSEYVIAEKQKNNEIEELKRTVTGLVHELNELKLLLALNRRPTATVRK